MVPRSCEKSSPKGGYVANAGGTFSYRPRGECPRAFCRRADGTRRLERATRLSFRSGKSNCYMLNYRAFTRRLRILLFEAVWGGHATGRWRGIALSLAPKLPCSIQPIRGDLLCPRYLFASLSVCVSRSLLL